MATAVLSLQIDIRDFGHWNRERLHLNCGCWMWLCPYFVNTVRTQMDAVMPLTLLGSLNFLNAEATCNLVNLSIVHSKLQF